MKKILSIVTLALTVITASAQANDIYTLSKGTNAHGSTTIKVGDAEGNHAVKGDSITIIITPEEGQVVAAVKGKLRMTWEVARTRGLAVSDMIAATKVKDKENTYYFIMPAANVEVSVVYIESIKVETKDSSEGDKDVDNVMVNIAPSDEEPIIENGVLVIPVTITSITVPAPTDPSATDNKDVTVYIAGEVLSSDGQTMLRVTNIAAGAFDTNGGSDTKISEVVLPETDVVINIEDGAMKSNGQLLDVISPMGLLADYALMGSMKENFEANKISAKVTAPNKYWTFSSGVDCVLPDGVTAHIAIWDAGIPRIVELTDSQLELKNGRRGVKANNGVLISSERGNAYEIVASPGNQASGSTPATKDANSYAGNCLVPTIKATNYTAGKFLVLKNNKFHTIASSKSKKVKPGKAVFSLEKAGVK